MSWIFKDKPPVESRSIGAMVSELIELHILPLKSIIVNLEDRIKVLEEKLNEQRTNT